MTTARPGWFSWVARRFRHPPALRQALPRLALLLGIHGAAMLAWFATTAGPAPVLPPHTPGAFEIAPLWLAPSVYLVAWQLVFLRPSWGAWAAVLFCLMGFGVTLFAGVLSLGVLAVPVGTAVVVAIGLWLAACDSEDAGPEGGAGRVAHVVGLLIFLFGLLPALLTTGTVFDREELPRSASAAGLFLTLGPLLALPVPHALLTTLLRGRGRAWPSLWPAATMLLPAWLLPALAFGLAWPVTLPARHAVWHEEMRVFGAAGATVYGQQAGRRLDLRTERDMLPFTVPEGWLGLMRPEEARRPVAAIRIARDPRQAGAPSPVTELRLAPRSPPIRLRGDVSEPTMSWFRYRCAPAAPDGTVSCRAVLSDPVPPGMLDLLPEAELTSRVQIDRQGAAWSFSILHREAEGLCWLDSVCTFRLPVSHGMQVMFDMPLAERHRWREARAEVADTLRRAAGLEVEEVSLLLGPGEVPVPPLP